MKLGFFVRKLVEAIRGTLGHYALFVHDDDADVPKHIRKCEEALSAFKLHSRRES